MLRIAPRGLAAVLIAGLLLPGMAGAGLLEGEPYVSFKLQRDSNVFRFESEQQAQAAIGSGERADTVRSYGAGLALQYSFGLQRAFLGGEVRRNQYQRFDYLDYNSNQLRGGIDWKIGRAAYGRLLAQQERRSESFVGRDNTQLGLQRETRLSGDGTLAVTPRWALQTRLENRRLRNTLAVSRNYNVDETTGLLGGLYTGLPVGEAGVAVELVHGRYPERQAAPGITDRYDQLSYKLNGAWRPSGLSTLRAEAGITMRDNRGGGVDDFEGFTGRLLYQRKWSGKTDLRAELFRRVNSVEQFDANFVAQTGVGVGFDWQLATKLGLFGSYEFVRDDYEGSPALNVAGDARRDDVHRAELGAKYQPLFWLSFTPSAVYEQRESNRVLRSYDDTIVGIDIEARYD